MTTEKSKTVTITDVLWDEDFKAKMRIREIADNVRREHQLERLKNKDEDASRRQRIRTIYDEVKRSTTRVTGIHRNIYKNVRKAQLI